MSPIAAYYVMIAIEHDRAQSRSRRVAPIVARPSRANRVAGALESLARLGRPSTTQPI
jgi:hypothetical protein